MLQNRGSSSLNFALLEIDIYTLADVGTHPVIGELVSFQQQLQNLMEEIERADQ
jgi:hypothetical protein